MSSPVIWELASSYRAFVMLQIAWKLDLFSQFEEGPQSSLQLSKSLDLDEVMLEALLLGLWSQGWIVKNSELWEMTQQLKGEIKAGLEAFLALESRLSAKWLREDTLVQAIQEGADHRVFTKEGFSLEEESLYREVIYGSKTVGMILKSLRLVKSKEVRILEISGGMGDLKGSIDRANKSLKKNVTYFSVPYHHLTDDLIGAYDLVFMFNVAHKLTQFNLGRAVELSYQVLNPEGYLCVMDIFLDIKPHLGGPFVLDWISHGGVEIKTSAYVVELLREKGFYGVSVKNDERSLLDRVIGAVQ